MATKNSAPRTHHAPAAARTNPAEAANSVSLQPGSPPGSVNEESVRARAYFLWEQAGHPTGDGAEFWLRAEQELQSRGS